MKTKLTVALALLAPLAFAQTYTPATPNKPVTTLGIQRVLTGTINSGTVLNQVEVLPLEQVSVYCTSTNNVSVSLVYVADNGQALRTDAAAVCPTTSTRLVNISATGIDFQGIVVSPTAGLTAANTVTPVFVRTPTVPKQF